MFSLFPSSLTPFRRFYFYVYRFAFLLETNICAPASLLKNGRCVNINRVEYIRVCVCVQIYAMYTSTLLCSCSLYKNLLKISHTQINITYQLDYITERNHFQYLCDFSKHFRHYFSPHLQHYFNNTLPKRKSCCCPPSFSLSRPLQCYTRGPGCSDWQAMLCVSIGL